MRRHSGSVVADSTAIETPVFLGGFERIRVPLREVPGGLYIVVGIEQHCRGALGSAFLRQNGRA